MLLTEWFAVVLVVVKSTTETPNVRWCWLCVHVREDGLLGCAFELNQMKQRYSLPLPQLTRPPNRPITHQPTNYPPQYFLSSTHRKLRYYLAVVQVSE